MDFKYNDVLSRPYKNADIAIIVEDNMMTTAKIFLDKACVKSYDVFADKGNIRLVPSEECAEGEGAVYNKANATAVLDSLKEDVDAMWEENFKAVCASKA